MKDAKKAAAGLAALGRGKDKMLVHMDAGEVGALERLANLSGGSLSKNPKTGLHEAGWLSSILPMVVGGAATIMTGGAAAPLMGALLGAGTGLLTGDKEQSPLMRAGLGALGGFGGAGLAGSIAGAGAAGAAGAGAAAAPAAAAAAPGVTAANTAMVTDAALLGGDGGLAALNAAAPTATSAAAPAAVAAPAANPMASMTGDQIWNAGQAAPDKWGAFQQGASDIFSSGARGEAARTGAMSAMPGGNYGYMAAAAPILTEATKEPEYDYEEDPTTYYVGSRYNPGTYNPNARLGESPFTGQGFTEGRYSNSYPGLTEMRDSFRAAEGGEVPAASAPDTDMASYYRNLISTPVQSGPATSGTALQQYMSDLDTKIRTPSPTTLAPAPTNPGGPTSALPTGPVTNVDTPFGGIGIPSGEGRPSYNPVTGQYDYGFISEPSTDSMRNPRSPSSLGSRIGMAGYAAGGRPMNGYAAGGMLTQGAGDGMSDSMPAFIKGDRPQPAALSDGEFVVPADVVSHLGNGSTSAGARRLHQMMDRVRRDRTGRKKQAPKVKADRYMPA